MSKVVWNIVLAWFPSVPIMVVRDDFSANVKQKIHADDQNLSPAPIRSRYHDHAVAWCYHQTAVIGRLLTKSDLVVVPTIVGTGQKIVASTPMNTSSGHRIVTFSRNPAKLFINSMPRIISGRE